MSQVGCRILTDFERAPKALIEAFRDIPVANLDDAMNRISAIDESIRPLNQGCLLGPAFTVKVPEGDNLMFHKAMDMVQPGDVVVIDAGGSTKRAIFGELMVAYCRLKGVAGIVVDGSVRDVKLIRSLDDFPVYAKGITPNGPYKNGPGEIGTSIVIGGQTVNPGDIVVADEDGVLFIRPKEAEAILEKVMQIQAMEEKIMETMRKEGTYLRPWVDAKLNELKCEIS